MSVAALPQTLVGEEIHFPDGLPGFAEARRFRLGDLGAELAPFLELVCLDPGPRFVVVPPGALWPAYTLELADDVAAAMDVHHEADAAILAIVTLHPGPEAPTVNLMAPLVVNVRTAVASQVVLQPHEAPSACPVTSASPLG